MTIEQFAEELKALLRKAEDAGLDVDEFCEIAENILANGWES
jgi:hypothetical protein